MLDITVLFMITSQFSFSYVRLIRHVGWWKFSSEKKKLQEIYHDTLCTVTGVGNFIPTLGVQTSSSKSEAYYRF
jgi:hypothetical protein